MKLRDAVARFIASDLAGVRASPDDLKHELKQLARAGDGELAAMLDRIGKRPRSPATMPAHSAPRVSVGGDSE